MKKGEKLFSWTLALSHIETLMKFTLACEQKYIIYELKSNKFPTI